MYNSVQHRKTPGSQGNIHNSAEKQTPLPVYSSIKIHVRSRKKKKGLIDRQHKLGLTFGYRGVIQISTDFANNLCEMFKREGVVCPLNLYKKMFQTGALDNLDVVPSQ